MIARRNFAKIIPCVVVSVWAMLLGSCGQLSDSDHQSKTTSAAQISKTPIDGFREIKFGSSFIDAIGTLGGDLFNPVAVSDCFKDLPLKGCYLSRNMEEVPFEVKDGIPYTLALSFNRWDKLTDIGLNYDREGGITIGECRQMHERTLDWLTTEYGEFRSQVRQGDKDLQKAKTGRKNAYEIAFLGPDSFVTSPLRTTSSSKSSVSERQPIVKWDSKRYVSLLSTFITVSGKPMCSVNVNFNEPQSVERPKG